MIQTLKNYLWHLPKAVVSSARYGFPAQKLTVIGVTGTKGKTSTSHMIYHILRIYGRGKVGLISTIGVFFSAKGGSAFSGGDEDIDTGLHVTSPDSRELQKLLRMAMDKGLTYVVLEVTSSGLDQFRVWGIKFKVSVITNIYPDHLDYHGTMEKYVAAKKKIINQSEAAVIPRDLPYFRKEGRGKKEEGRRKIVEFESGISIVSANRAAAMAAVKVLGVPEVEAVNALKDFKGVRGRLEVVYQDKFLVVIDFAHTPESLAAALGELRKFVKRNGRLIAVFGCAGGRDHGRRRMGEVAAKMADLFVITAEDPRTETVEEISNEIVDYARKAGAVEITKLTNEQTNKRTNKSEFIRIPDRQEAINYAISLAKEGDVVGLFGKGHEKSMCFGKKEMPWSEYEAVHRALDSIRRK